MVGGVYPFLSARSPVGRVAGVPLSVGALIVYYRMPAQKQT